MKSYFLSVLGWITGSVFVGTFIVGEGLIIFLPLSIILGPVGNLFGDYLIKKMGLKTSNPFITSLTGSLLFFISLGLFGFSESGVAYGAFASYIIISWLFFWIIGGPIILLIDFLQKKNSLPK